MEKGKFIYILTHKYDLTADGDDLDDIILAISTDIHDVLSSIRYPDSSHRTVWVVKDGGRYFDEIQIYVGAEKRFRKYLPYVYTKECDKEEIDYVEKCLTVWCSARDIYYEEIRKGNDEKYRQMEEKRDRKEYERLKKKFEQNHES